MRAFWLNTTLLILVYIELLSFLNATNQIQVISSLRTFQINVTCKNQSTGEKFFNFNQKIIGISLIMKMLKFKLKDTCTLNGHYYKNLISSKISSRQLPHSSKISSRQKSHKNFEFFKNFK
jgi:hypothetical protein